MTATEKEVAVTRVAARGSQILDYVFYLIYGIIGLEILFDLQPPLWIYVVRSTLISWPHNARRRSERCARRSDAALCGAAKNTRDAERFSTRQGKRFSTACSRRPYRNPLPARMRLMPGSLSLTYRRRALGKLSATEVQIRVGRVLNPSYPYLYFHRTRKMR